MELPQPSSTQWGKLTSLNPDFENISLSENPSNLVLPLSLQEQSNSDSSGNLYECQICQEEQGYILSYKGDDLTIEVNIQEVQLAHGFKIHSGDRITLTMKDGEKLEYVFSSELNQTQRTALKRDREEEEESALAEKKIKFQENFKGESACLICEKMVYECVSAVPCLHSFCMGCLMEHLKRTQDCPACEERFVEFRKNVFLNNLVEGYEESGYVRDLSLEERQRLERKVVARFEYANEDVYEGEWRNCRKDGSGTMVYGCEGERRGEAVSGVYEGDWKNNKRHGQGKMRLFDGETYEGEWRNDCIEGKGKLCYISGDVYEGDFRDGNREGKGKMVYSDGNSYEGEWKNGIKEGKGEFRWKDGSVYEGECKNDLIAGQGKMIYADGDVYEGSWVNERREGVGKQVCANGDIYEGDFRNDQPQGKGKMIFSDGAVYEGEWKGGCMEGKGKMTYPKRH